MPRNKSPCSLCEARAALLLCTSPVPDVRPVVNMFTPVTINGCECGLPLRLTMLGERLFVSVTDLLRAAGYSNPAQAWLDRARKNGFCERASAMKLEMEGPPAVTVVSAAGAIELLNSLNQPQGQQFKQAIAATLLERMGGDAALCHCDADPPLLPAACAEEQHKLFVLCSNPNSIVVSLPYRVSAGTLCYAVLASSQAQA